MMENNPFFHLRREGEGGEEGGKRESIVMGIAWRKINNGVQVAQLWSAVAGGNFFFHIAPTWKCQLWNVPSIYFIIYASLAWLACERISSSDFSLNLEWISIFHCIHGKDPRIQMKLLLFSLDITLTTTRQEIEFHVIMSHSSDCVLIFMPHSSFTAPIVCALQLNCHHSLLTHPKKKHGMSWCVCFFAHNSNSLSSILFFYLLTSGQWTPWQVEKKICMCWGKMLEEKKN